MFSILFLMCVIFSNVIANEDQCHDSRYTNQLSLIKLIPFSDDAISDEWGASLNDLLAHPNTIKQPFIDTIRKHAPWVNNAETLVDQMVNQTLQMHLQQFDTSNEIGGVHTSELAALSGISNLATSPQTKSLSNNNANDIRDFISALSTGIIKEIETQKTTKLNQTPDVNQDAFPIPSPFYFINVGRLLVGQIIAERNCGFIESYGFRRYLRNPKRQPTDPDHFRPSEFNYGHTFVYPTLADFQLLGLSHPAGLLADQHRLITNALSIYATENYPDGENVLFVNIFIRSNEAVLYRISCGIFVSGTGQPTFKIIRDIYNATGSVNLSLIQSSWRDIEPFTSGIMPQSVKDLTPHLKCYDKKPFLYPSNYRRFPTASGDEKQVRAQVKEILGEWVEPPSKSNVSSELASRIELFYGESPVASRADIYEENTLHGVLRAESKKSKEGEFGRCFHQSEQHFVTLLNADEDELLQLRDHLCVESNMGALENQESSADNVVICLYNRKDTCRYCRGTFSHMLATKLMNRKICSFIDKMSKKSGGTIFSDAYEKISMKFYAFAKETTDL